VPHATPSNGIPQATPHAVPHATPSKNGIPNATPNATPTIKPQGTPHAVPTKPKQGTPYLVPSKSKQGTPHAVPHATPSNGIPQATPHAVPHATPLKNGIPNATPHAVPTIKPQGTPHVVPQGQSSIPTKVNASTNVATPGFFDRMKNYFRGDQKKIIEPGIQNKEVESYRTDDAKEVEYKDTIIQDDKDVTLPKKHMK
jgi:hypothetical protein